MACIHNQSKIDELNSLIDENKKQIGNLEFNITKCTEIEKKHKNFNEKISCVINNLDGNTVVAGVSYDYGKMTECLKSSNETISDCDDLIINSQKKIDTLNEEIAELKKSISLLQGDCYSCVVAKEKEKGK